MQELSHVLSTFMSGENYQHEKKRIEEERERYAQAHPDTPSPVEASYSLTLKEVNWTNQVTISTPGAYVFGRGRGLEDFKHGSASKLHFILELRNDGTLTIQDMGTMNGTFVDVITRLKTFEVYALPEKVSIIAGLATIQIARQ